MAQTYTLDEAAGKLGISVDEMKKKLREEWKHIRSLRDGSTLRFKASEIDELARTQGGSSEDEVRLPDITKPASAVGSSKKPASDDDIPLILDSGPDLDLGDVPLIKTSSDSDVRLEKANKGKSPKQEVTEEISLELPKPTKGASGKIPKPAENSDSSEFELTLETDSDEFELSLNTDSSSSEDVDIGKSVKGGPAAGRSGINLNKPADSGVSLEKNRKPESSDDIEFEVNLDSPSKSGKKEEAYVDSDSEFELNLDESSSDSHPALEGEKGDIFETDFELPALEDDSASEVQALDESGTDTDVENSDFDLAVEGSDGDSDSEESASEVVELDEDAPKAKKGAKAKGLKSASDGGISFDEIDLDDSISASRALRGVNNDEGDIELDEDGQVVRGGAMVPAPADWGWLPVGVLIPCMLLMFVGALMSFELLHSMWGYQQTSKPAGFLVEGVAKLFGFEVKE
ncbi:hypothetical protein KIH39_20065 [Telmatocola sphagniphila]|uniref:Uncharacterized protein n=1 Tax=Telmatocola sphagniphila TaxID=1123043 RepID=A0A8E6B468_9BACT|nr:hypothetical protein [Telmatocola sphagniphila]QVL31124.1 hypothetical protein KIH39_20065 [Telmatocola sphagniphila]